MYLKVIVVPKEGDRASKFVWGKFERIHYETRPIPKSVDESHSISNLTLLTEVGQEIERGEKVVGEDGKERKLQGVLMILKYGVNEARSVFTDGRVFLLNDDGQTIERIF